MDRTLSPAAGTDRATPPDAALAARVDELVRTMRWTARPLSWTLVADGRFYKIDRRSGDVAADLVNPEARARARIEHDLTCRLAALDPAVVTPIALVGSCLVAPALTGDDMVTALRRGDEERDAALEAALSLIGRLHRAEGAALEGVTAHDYAENPYLPAPPALRERLGARPRTLVVRGFEVRNFRAERPGGAWRFFDPHQADLAAPEEDVARFVVSLLMLNWGRHANVRAWDRFVPERLISTYEGARGLRLDREVLAYAFALNVAMRRFHSRGRTAGLAGARALAAAAYRKAYFWQIERWGRRHGL